ncbi:MAG TPA: hypothetical protein VG028_21755 [Terriglobia bacterium]|nr:hypothetical protein [Terriglobia bacterium]
MRAFWTRLFQGRDISVRIFPHGIEIFIFFLAFGLAILAGVGTGPAAMPEVGSDKWWVLQARMINQFPKQLLRLFRQLEC